MEEVPASPIGSGVWSFIFKARRVDVRTSYINKRNEERREEAGE